MSLTEDVIERVLGRFATTFGAFYLRRVLGRRAKISDHARRFGQTRETAH